jgi:hypothetical protein
LEVVPPDEDPECPPEELPPDDPPEDEPEELPPDEDPLEDDPPEELPPCEPASSDVVLPASSDVVEPASSFDPASGAVSVFPPSDVPPSSDCDPPDEPPEEDPLELELEELPPDEDPDELLEDEPPEELPLDELLELEDMPVSGVPASGHGVTCPPSGRLPASSPSGKSTTWLPTKLPEHAATMIASAQKPVFLISPSFTVHLQRRG